MGPFLAMSRPPVRNPLPMEFHGSSLSLSQIREQSNDEYIQPHTPKFPTERKREREREIRKSVDH